MVDGTDVLERLDRNRSAVLDRVHRAAEQAGRDPSALRVVAVTKTVEPEVAARLAALGCGDLGENRVAELERKATWFAERRVAVRWHFIGHVQRNKARRIVRLADEIHSVDSARLIETLGRLAREERRRPGIFLQAKLTPEETKSGASLAELAALLACARAEELPVLGLMGMAPLTDAGTRAASEAFETLARVAGELPSEGFVDGRIQLSMGMSGDFEEAIAAGAHVLRIGSAFFDGVPAPEPASGDAR